MKTLILIFSVFALIATTSCKNKEKATSTDTANKSGNSKSMKGDQKYRFIISYNSIGTGIDSDAFNKMEKFAKEHAKKPVYDTYTYGREGERDIAFQLKEMKSADQATFIKEMKNAIGESDRVNYKENEVPSGTLWKDKSMIKKSE